MMAMEDVGVLVRCLKHYCCKGGSFDDSTANLEAAAAVYQVSLTSSIVPRSCMALSTIQISHSPMLQTTRMSERLTRRSAFRARGKSSAARTRWARRSSGERSRGCII